MVARFELTYQGFDDEGADILVTEVRGGKLFIVCDGMGISELIRSSRYRVMRFQYLQFTQES
jgi:hypothetical protein